jgi:hypothetical protein
MTNYQTKYAKEFAAFRAQMAKPIKYVQAMAKDTRAIRSLILNGPAGVGKTYSVESALERYAAGRYKKVNTKSTALNLYMDLYQYSEPGDILFLDDCDSVLTDMTGVNLLKAALDSIPTRTVNWNTSTSILEKANIPYTFQFAGAIIINTNIGYDNKTRKLEERLSAIRDRAFSIDFDAYTDRDYMFKNMCFMVYDQDMLQAFSLTTRDKNIILAFVDEHRSTFRKFSLRALVKIVELYKTMPEDWQEMSLAAV